MSVDLVAAASWIWFNDGVSWEQVSRGKVKEFFPVEEGAAPTSRRKRVVDSRLGVLALVAGSPRSADVWAGRIGLHRGVSVVSALLQIPTPGSVVPEALRNDIGAEMSLAPEKAHAAPPRRGNSVSMSTMLVIVVAFAVGLGLLVRCRPILALVFGMLWCKLIGQEMVWP